MIKKKLKAIYRFEIVTPRCLVSWGTGEGNQEDVFVCFVLNDRPKGTRYDQFGHGDLNALPCPSLWQAATRPLSTNITAFRKCYFEDSNQFWAVPYLV